MSATVGSDCGVSVRALNEVLQPTIVSAQPTALRTAVGVRLDLVGVTLVGFRSAA